MAQAAQQDGRHDASAAAGSTQLGRSTTKDTQVDAAQARLEDSTLSGLFLSGQFTSFASTSHSMMIEEEGEEDDDETDIAISYFPDPPCVLPPDEEEDEEDVNHRPNIVEYWKHHASSYDSWPQVRHMREKHANFRLELGVRKTRTSSIMHNKVFVNVSPSQLGIRRSATLEEGEKTGEVIEPGQLVLVRETVEKGGVRFWKLRDMNGYIFESKDGVRIMQEAMNVETGQWWYRVVCDSCLEIRKSPGYENELRTGWVLSPGELVVCTVRCRIGSSSFLLLKDGRGWMFLWKPMLTEAGKMRASQEPAMEECETDFLDVAGASQDFRRAIPPTDSVVDVGSWRYIVQKRPVLCLGAKQHGTFLNPGDIIRIDKRVTASGSMHRSETMQERVWLRLLDGRGWVPIHGDDGFEQLVEQDPSDLTYPAWFTGNHKLDVPKEAWMVGFV